MRDMARRIITRTETSLQRVLVFNTRTYVRIAAYSAIRERRRSSITAAWRGGFAFRTFVTHRTTSSIHPRTRAEARPIADLFAKTDRIDCKCQVPREGAPALGGRIAPPWHVTGHCDGARWFGCALGA